MTPSWYDLLDVDPAASADEVRAAWKAAISDLDPTDRRFRVYNQAAEVLLDPDRRASYDAGLAAERAADDAPEPAEPDVPAGPVGVPVTAGVPPRRGIPAWLLVVVAVLTAALVGVAAWLWLQGPSDSELEQNARSARATAERAVGPILSYDAKDLEGSRAAAVSYLTADYRKEYEKFFAGVMEANAPRTGTVVAAELVRSSIVRAGEDRVEVFVLVDQSRTNKRSQEPTVYQNWVTLTMEQVDGDWLVAGMRTT